MTKPPMNLLVALLCALFAISVIEIADADVVRADDDGKRDKIKRKKFKDKKGRVEGRTLELLKRDCVNALKKLEPTKEIEKAVRDLRDTDEEGKILALEQLMLSLEKDFGPSRNLVIQDRLRNITDAVLYTAGHLTNAEAMDELYGDILAEETDHRFRIQLLKSAVALKTDIFVDFLLAAAESEMPTLRMVAATAMGEVKTPRDYPDVFEAMKKLLNDAAWRVRKGAIMGCTELCKEKGGEPFMALVPELIDVLIDEQGLLRTIVADALKKVAKVDFGPDHQSWLKWWRRFKEGDPMSSSEVSETRKHAKEKKKRSTSWGISSESKRLIYVIDCSESMKQKIPVEHRNITGGKKGGDDNIEWDKVKTRLDLARVELIRSINALPDDAMFNIIAFSDNMKSWQDTIVEADKKNKKSAIDWAKSLTYGKQTNIYGALDKAIRMAELAMQDSQAEDAGKNKRKRRKRRTGKDDEPEKDSVENDVPDTIFFLTDGFATTGKYYWDQNDKMKSEDELKKDYYDKMKIMVKELETRNWIASMTIHTVAISKEADSITLEDISEATGGVMKKVARATRGG